MTVSIVSEQAGWLDREDQNHRRIQREIRNFGKKRLAEIVREPNRQRTDRGAAERTHTADDDDGKGKRQHLEIEAGIDAKEAATDDAAERREEGAEGKDDH